MRLFNCGCYLIIKAVCGILNLINGYGNENGMTLQQLKYIITIAECGSITSAAGKLLVAQPSLSNQCQSLKRKWALRYFIVIIEECIYPRTAQNFCHMQDRLWNRRSF